MSGEWREKYPSLSGLLGDGENKQQKITCEVLEQIAELLAGNKVDDKEDAMRHISGLCTVMSEKEELEFGMILGEGEFGRVWKGTWRGGDCAIKELRSGHSARIKQERDTFTREIRQLQELRHANIVQYYGSQMKGDNLYLLTEYISGGCLSEWLRTQRCSAERLSVDFFLKIAEDVAVGLNVMHCAGFLHCDIAARNVLKADGCCKISDLGLSRKLPFRLNSMKVKVVPVRWSPPETIKSMTVNFASDVWGYGVFLWEVFTYCSLVPYCDVQGNVLEAIADKRALLEQPRGCPDVVWSNLIMQCLNTDAEERPPMSGILDSIRTLKSDSYLCSSQVPLVDDYVDHTGLLALSSIWRGASPASPTLNLSNCTPRLIDADMAKLAAALPHLFYTKILLRGNCIGDEGCLLLAEGVANDTLQTIDLTNNCEITRVGRELLEDCMLGPKDFLVSVSEFGGCKLRPLASALAGIKFDPTNDNLLVAWGEVSDKLQLWDVGALDGQITMLMELQAEPHVRDAAWDKDGNRLAATCAAGGKSKYKPCVLVWDPQGESYDVQKPWLIPSDSNYVNFKFHPTIADLLLVFKAGNAMCIFHTPTKTKVYSYTTLALPQKAIPLHVEVFSPGKGCPDLLVWGVKNKVTIHMLPVDTTLGCMRSDAEEAKANWGSPVCIASPHTTETVCVKLRPNCKELQIASCGNDDRIMVHDGRGKKLWMAKGPREFRGTRHLCFSHDGAALYVTCGKSILALDAATGKKLPKQFSPFHTGSIQRISINNTGTKLATCAIDKNLGLWHCAATAVISTRREPAFEISASETLTALSTEGSALYSYAAPEYYEEVEAQDE